MKCPYCKSWQTRIVDSRMVGDRRRRRYECYDCKNRFTTYEYGAIESDKVEQLSKQNTRYKDAIWKIIQLAEGSRNEQSDSYRASDSTAKD